MMRLLKILKKGGWIATLSTLMIGLSFSVQAEMEISADATEISISA